MAVVFTDSAQDQDMKTMETSGTIETIAVPADLVGGRLDYPRRVSKVSYSFCTRKCSETMLT